MIAPLGFQAQLTGVERVLDTPAAALAATRLHAIPRDPYAPCFQWPWARRSLGSLALVVRDVPSPVTPRVRWRRGSHPRSSRTWRWAAHRPRANAAMSLRSKSQRRVACLCHGATHERRAGDPGRGQRKRTRAAVKVIAADAGRPGSSLAHSVVGKPGKCTVVVARTEGPRGNACSPARSSGHHRIGLCAPRPQDDARSSILMTLR